MRAKRVRWLGKDRRQQLLVALQAQVQAWSEEWSVTPGGFQVELLDSDNVWDATSWRWGVAVGRAGMLYLGVPWQSLGSLGGLLAQASVDNDLGLGRRIAERAIQSLVARLAGDAAVTLQPGEPPAGSEREERFGGLSACLRSPGFHAVLWLDNRLCDVLCPTPQLDRGGLHRRESAMGSETVTLNVLFDLGPATIGDTKGLRVGEVLVSRVPLEGSFQLAVPDGRQVASASLFRADSSRAVLIESA